MDEVGRADMEEGNKIAGAKRSWGSARYHTEESAPIDDQFEDAHDGEDIAALSGIDQRCGAKAHRDFDGPAVSWGLSFKTVRWMPNSHTLIVSH